MPVQIGARPANFSDPTALLSDCHRRIEMFLGSLQAVAKVLDDAWSAETAQALELALRYFRDAAPKHTADEEESLFPRLRQLKDEEVLSAMNRMNQLEQEHDWAIPLHERVEQLGQKYIQRTQLTLPEVQEFCDAVARLATMYRSHIDVEDSLVFPMAARVLSPAQTAAIGEEMADRRRVKLVTDIAQPLEELCD